MDGTVSGFVHGERLRALGVTPVAQEEPTRLQHVVTTYNPLIEVSPRVVTGEAMLLRSRLSSQGTLSAQLLLLSPASDKSFYVNQTGDNRAPEWKDGFDQARPERTLEAVRSRPLFGGSPLQAVTAAGCRPQTPVLAVAR
jgi:hypothetical protein